MKCNMIRQAALDLILRDVRAGVTGVALADEIPRVYACDGAADPPRFRVPTDAITDLKACRHGHGLNVEILPPCSQHAPKPG